MPCRPASTKRRDNFRRRNRTLIKKANELAQTSGAEVFWIVRYHGQIYTYASHSGKAWPPSRNEIVSALEDLEMLGYTAKPQIRTKAILSLDLSLQQTSEFINQFPGRRRPAVRAMICH